MSENSSTTDASTQPSDVTQFFEWVRPTEQQNDSRSPVELLHDSLEDLILVALSDAWKISPHDLPSHYLARCQYVSAEKLGKRYCMRFVLRVKAQDQAADAAALTVEFVVRRNGESC